MTIRSRNKRSGWTAIPNFRIEDASLDPYDLRVAMWLFSHADTYAGKTNRAAIARAVGISADRAGTSLRNLRELAIIHFEDGGEGRGGVRSELEIEVDHDAWMTDPSKRHTFDSKRQASETADAHIYLGEDQEKTPLTPQGGNEVDLASETSTEVVVDRFEELWAQFPKIRGTKAEALKRWNGLSQTQRDHVMRVLPDWLAYWQARGPAEAQFIPACASWLGTDRTKHPYEGFIPPLPATNQPKPNSPMGILAAIAERDHQ